MADEQPSEPAETGSEPIADGVEQRLASVAERAGIAKLMQNEALTAAEVLQVLGGVRGLVETILPGLAFVVVFAVTDGILQLQRPLPLQLSLGVSLGLALVFVAARLLQRSPTRSAFVGLLAAAASAALALVTGNSSDNYLLGLIVNAVYGAAMLISVLIGWPLVGLLMGFVMGDGVAWRHHAKRLRIMNWLTLMWTAMFGVRLLVEVPFYLAENTVALGTTRLLLGTPLYAVILVLTWIIVRGAYPSANSAE